MMSIIRRLGGAAQAVMNQRPEFGQALATLKRAKEGTRRPDPGSPVQSETGGSRVVDGALAFGELLLGSAGALGAFGEQTGAQEMLPTNGSEQYSADYLGTVIDGLDTTWG